MLLLWVGSESVIGRSGKGFVVIHRFPSPQSYNIYTMMAEDGEYTRAERGMAIGLLMFSRDVRQSG